MNIRAKALGAAVLATLAGCGSSDPEGSSSISSTPSSSSSSSSSVGSYNPGTNQVTTDVRIKLNQLGFLPSSPKAAVVPDVAATEFYILDSATDQVVYSGTLSNSQSWEPSGESVKSADFSSFTASGNYQLHVPGVEPSYEFSVGTDILQEVHDAAAKAYYYNRASTALEATYAGQWARSAGHPDTEVRIHPSAATSERPAESTISAPKGWYDAGDFGKYIVNSGISTYTLLLALEQYGDFYADRQWNIPESGDAIPDLLNEIMWNLEWMENMQDSDGGVYHKLTTKEFSGEIMPEAGTSPRYVVQKTTAATLNFAAVMAMASRVLDHYPNAYPGKAQAYRTAATQAWSWAQANNNVIYSQPDDVETGTYGDVTVDDEFSWAAAELFLLTQDNQYLDAHKARDAEASTPWWGGVSALGLISLAGEGEGVLSAADLNDVESKLMSTADYLLSQQSSSAYGVTINDSRGFNWGSNSAFLNDAMMLIQGYRISGEQKYINAAWGNMDYVLGRNATDYSFVTGYGDFTPMDIHHRQSVADDVAAPIPGFVVGGPHSGQPDTCDYPSDLAAKSFFDGWCSYSTNEVTVNWNAPLVYVLASLIEND